MTEPDVRQTTSVRARAVNERIRELFDKPAVGQTDVTRYLCECGDGACLETLELSLEAYGRTREDPRLALVARRHERAGDEVIRRTARYSLVLQAGARSDDAPSHAHLESVLEGLRVRAEGIRAELHKAQTPSNS